jgi:hypothetical protein
VDLSISVGIGSNGGHLRLEYSTGLYDEATISRVAAV